MISVYPDFFDRFECKAADCRHSCCEGWEIDVDEDTAGYYRMKPGQLGEELASSMYEDEDGTHFMMTEDMRCPFLRDDGLCRIVIAYGEESLCDVCALHPRFYYDHGDYELCGLGLSCERTCELLWETEEPLRFFGYEFSEEESSEEDGVSSSDDGMIEFTFPQQALSYEPCYDPDYVQSLLKLYAGTDPIDGSWMEEISELLNNVESLVEKAGAYSKEYDKKRYDRLYHYIIYRQLEKSESVSEEPNSGMDHCKSMIIDGSPTKALEEGLKPSIIENDIMVFARRAMDFIFLTDAFWGDTKERIRRFSEQIEYSEENMERLYDHPTTFEGTL